MFAFGRIALNNEPKDTKSPHTASDSAADVSAKLALDSSLLAWVRTGITLMGCGFTLAKFVHALIRSQAVELHTASPRILGLVLMSIGVFGLIGGIFQYISFFRKLPNRSWMWSPALILSVSVTIVAFWLLSVLLVDLTDFKVTPLQ